MYSFGVVELDECVDEYGSSKFLRELMLLNSLSVEQSTETCEEIYLPGSEGLKLNGTGFITHNL